MGAAFDSLAELAAKGARAEVDALEHARAVLLAIVRAKRSGVANPEAWADAFAITDAADLETASKPRPASLRCPHCRAILRAPPENLVVGPPRKRRTFEVPNEPRDVECGRSHVFVYDGLRVWINEDESPPRWDAEGETTHRTENIPFESGEGE